jgi:hypothetical protein
VRTRDPERIPNFEILEDLRRGQGCLRSDVRCEVGKHGSLYAVQCGEDNAPGGLISGSSNLHDAIEPFWQGVHATLEVTGAITGWLIGLSKVNNRPFGAFASANAAYEEQGLNKLINARQFASKSAGIFCSPR